jgi:hypothetical protein
MRKRFDFGERESSPWPKDTLKRELQRRELEFNLVSFDASSVVGDGPFSKNGDPIGEVGIPALGLCGIQTRC